MKRWHDELPLMTKRWLTEQEKHRDRTFNVIDSACHCLRGAGFMRKRRPYGCGRPRCQLCHYSKVFRYWHLREARRRGWLNARLEGLWWEGVASGVSV